MEFQTSFGLSIWEQISKEFFSKLYPPESTTIMSTKPTKPTTMHKKSTKDDDSTNDGANVDEKSDDSAMDTSTSKHYRPDTLSRSLSKYGPWGYLILGMLLCGGALLVCVLWGKNQKNSFLTCSHSISSIFAQCIPP